MTEREKLERLINELPCFFVSANTSIDDLEKLENGIYNINQCLPISLFRKLPYFKNSSGEVGLILADNNWFLVTNDDPNIALPFYLYKILSDGKVQFCAHSHPYDGRFNNTNIPSISDLFAKDIKGFTYIISEEGFTEINVSSLSLEAKTSLNQAELLFDGDISSNEYLQFMKELYEKVGLEYRVINHDNEDIICNIISQKKKLEIDYWEEDVCKHMVPFPKSKHK